MVEDMGYTTIGLDIDCRVRFLFLVLLYFFAE